MEVFLDTETTGLDPGHDEILEIAIVDAAGEVLVNSLVRPVEKQSWAEAERIHGITFEMVKDAPTLSELMGTIADAVRGKDLVIYNADFDLGFLPGLEPASVQCCMEDFAEEYGEWSDHHGNWKWQRLATAACFVHHEDVPGHRALGDAVACRAVWLYLTNAAERERVERLRAERELDERIGQHFRWEEIDRRSRDNERARFMSSFWNVWWLRLAGPRHWTREGWRRQGEPEEEFAQIFFGRSIAFLEAEERYHPIYKSRGRVPPDLWPAGRFPKFQWYRDELEESGHAFIHNGMIHPLYPASEKERIDQEFSLRLKGHQPEYNRTQLRNLGYSKTQIEAMTPYAERMNRISGSWYYVWLKSDVDQVIPENPPASKVPGWMDGMNPVVVLAGRL